jgi:hypothetical protein
MKATWIMVFALGLAGNAMAGIEVVSDAACPYYAVDIESFATCDGDRVARAPAAAEEVKKAALDEAKPPAFHPPTSSATLRGAPPQGRVAKAAIKAKPR